MKWDKGLSLYLLILLVFLISCSKAPQYREYVEIRRGGGNFDQAISGFFSLDTDKDQLLLSTGLNEANLFNGIKWKVPNSWQESTKDNQSKNRLATFITDQGNGLKVTLISFPGEGGGFRSNLQRWLKQIKLVLDEEQLNEIISVLKAETNPKQIKYFLIDFESMSLVRQLPHSETILAAIIKFQDQTLFVKLQGTIYQVIGERKRFLEFLNSLSLRS